jgi:deoxyribodipyrimidine photolyase-related protein
MSDYPDGEWTEQWDASFGILLMTTRFFAKNPRLGMMLRTLEKMPEENENSI